VSRSSPADRRGAAPPTSDLSHPTVEIRPWSESDLGLLRRLMDDPAMTAHLGGPESSKAIAKRHRRYVGPNEPGTGQMFAILVGPERHPAGSVGYWERDWRNDTVWETGWSVLPEFQGQGIAGRGTAAVIERARVEGTHGRMHAFPSVDNPASNAICRKLGFTFLEEVDFEYPPGHAMRCNDWRLDLQGGG
jgi:RimJ/RimL family protein N-acetyltransferase